MVFKYYAERGTLDTSALATPLAIPHAVPVIGFSLLSLVILVQLGGAIKHLFSPRSTSIK